MTNTHGGRRNGSGRPPIMTDGGRVQYYLPKHIRLWIKQNGGSFIVTQLVQAMIEETEKQAELRARLDKRGNCINKYTEETIAILCADNAHMQKHLVNIHRQIENMIDGQYDIEIMLSLLRNVQENVNTALKKGEP